jgi:predicted DNA-binding protein (UPF0251 family)
VFCAKKTLNEGQRFMPKMTPASEKRAIEIKELLKQLQAMGYTFKEVEERLGLSRRSFTRWKLQCNSTVCLALVKLIVKNPEILKNERNN